MTSDKVYAIVFDRLVEQLETAGNWKKGWSWNELPRNYETGHIYSGFNLFYLMFSGRQNPYWLTFNQIQKQGGQVKKGERATALLMPITKKRQEKDDDGNPILDENGKKVERQYISGFRYYKVWNLEQTTGVPNKKLPSRKERDNAKIPTCEEILTFMKPHLETKAGEPSFSPSKDIIRMPPMSAFDSSEEYYATFFHELTHWTGHPSRLNRNGMKNVKRRSKTYSREELIAEIGALFLCAFTEIDSSTAANAAAYVQGYYTHLKKEPKELVTAASEAYRATKFILDFGGKKSPKNPIKGQTRQGAKA